MNAVSGEKRLYAKKNWIAHDARQSMKATTEYGQVVVVGRLALEVVERLHDGFVDYRDTIFEECQ